MMRDMYNTVLGEGMGELEAATRRTCGGFGEVPVGGVLGPVSIAGERAKLGILNASMGLERGGRSAFGLSADVFLSTELSSGFGRSAGFVTVTWYMPDGPFPELPLPDPLQRPHIGRKGLP
jgi:hypothetical protein